MPSLWPEPFGRVPVEALAHGIAPLVSSIGGLPEAVNHDERLLIRHPLSVEEWVQRITAFMENPESMHEIIEKHRQDMKKFSPEVQGGID